MKIFLVQSGEVILQPARSDSENQIRANLGPGDFFGELTLLGFTEQPVSAVAATDCDLLVLDTPILDELLRVAPLEFMRNLSRASIERMQSATRESLRDIQLVLGSLVHDLKNPISTAMMTTELIADEPTKDIQPRLEMINRSMARMLSLVQDVLDASRGKTSIRIGTIEMHHLMTELEELVLARIRSRGTTVVAHLEFEGTFPGDARATARALANIIKNAGEAMKGSGTLTIDALAADGRVVFRISDTGPGIHPKVLAGLFDPLVSYGKEGGSGFGMTITKTIAEAHGGTVRLVETSDRGTTFEMTLPLQSRTTADSGQARDQGTQVGAGTTPERA